MSKISSTLVMLKFPQMHRLRALPAVASQEGVYVCKATASGGGVSQMPHVDFACEREVLFGIGGVFFLVVGNILKTFCYSSKNFLYGCVSCGAFPVYEFLSCRGLHFDACNAGTFLPRLCCFSIMR